jgi:NAD(P)H-dependent FMN reductase
VLELRKINLHIYDPSGTTSFQPYSNNNSNNNDLERITATLKWADALVLASPDYHGSMSGAMKTSLITFGKILLEKHLDT